MLIIAVRLGLDILSASRFFFTYGQHPERGQVAHMLAVGELSNDVDIGRPLTHDPRLLASVKPLH
jgi:hypothetical protein